MVGALLITLAAVGAFALGQRDDRPSTSSFVVVTKPIAPGTRLDAGALATRPLPLDGEIAAQSFGTIEQVLGAVALAPMNPGQLVPRAAVAAPSEIGGEIVVGHELTFPVERDRVPANLRRGELVAVLATYGTGSDARTTTTAQRATVLSFDTEADTIGSTRTARLTVLLDDPETVIATAHASHAADLTIVRTTQAGVALPGTFGAGDTTANRP
jgi:hypothetical protein